MTNNEQPPVFSGQSPAINPAPMAGFRRVPLALLSDGDARSFAVDPEHSVVLEASAGTGKTSILVDRYLGLLGRGVDPSNILAITFTRKAAAEMRERIMRDLRGVAERPEEDQARWRELRDRLGDIAIGTIDAFCLSLLREFPLEADLDPGFGMADETEVPRLVQQAIDQTLRVAAGQARRDSDIALLLAELGVARARAGLEHLLERRLVARRALDRFVAFGPLDLSGEVACRRAAERLRDLLGGGRGGLSRLIDDGPLGHPRFAMLAADLRRLDHLPRAGSATIRSVLDRVGEYFLTSAGRPRRRLDSQRYGKQHYASPDAWGRHRDAVVELAPAVADAVAAFRRDLNVVLARGVYRLFAITQTQYRRVLEARAALDFSDVLARALELLQQMDEFAQSRYRLEARYHHVLVDEFQDTSRAQWELVRLLIQSWGEGLGLLADAPLQPTIFIVGDRKQSIYRFRDAEVAVLSEAAAYIDALRPGSRVRRSITHSFRALPELLHFTNDLCDEVQKALPRPDAFRYDQDDRFPVAETVGEARRCVLGLSAGNTTDDCARAVAAEISRLRAEEHVRDREQGTLREVRPGDIAILFRSRNSHREFERALEDRGIPAYVYKGLGFFDADEVKDLSALVRYLADPQSDLRAAAFLRSRLVRLSDTALARLAPRVADALLGSESPAALRALDDEDRRVVELVRPAVGRWVGLVDRVPPAELLDQALAESAYAFELRGPRVRQARENVKKLRALIRRVQNRGYATMARIADHLHRLSTGDESNAVIDALDAVNLMTVHAAKGLEFPIVFVVNLSRGAGGPRPPIRVLPGQDDDEPLVSVGGFSSAAERDEGARDLEETKRLLYVAVTRARDRLYLASELDDGCLQRGRGSLGAVLPDSFAEIFEAAQRAAPHQRTVSWTARGGRVHEFRICRAAASETVGRPVDDGTPIGPPRADFSSIPPADLLPRVAVTATVGVTAAPVIAGEDSLRRASELILGRLVHRLFQTRRDTDEDSDAIWRRAHALLRTEEARGEEEVDALVTRAVEVYGTMRRRPDVLALLEGECLFEVPFSLRLDPASLHLINAAVEAPAILRGTIDCLVRQRDESIRVVEFKTGARRPEHEAQLAVYVAAARALFPGARVTGSLVYA